MLIHFKYVNKILNNLHVSLKRRLSILKCTYAQASLDKKNYFPVKSEDLMEKENSSSQGTRQGSWHACSTLYIYNYFHRLTETTVVKDTLPILISECTK